MAGGVFPGAGIGPRDVESIIGIVKAYTTRVGEGPMPTELNDDIGEALRKHGNEFGATTGRPRRCGWLDVVQLRRAVMVNGITHLVITKPDVLGVFETIRICTAYMVDGAKTETFPTSLARIESAQPIYEDMPGWNSDISGCRAWDEFPAEAQAYFKRLEELVGVRIAIVSVGPGREQTVVCVDPFN